MAEAKDRFKSALSVQPDRADLHYGLGLMEMHGGNFKDALSQQNRAIECDPKFAPAYGAKGDALQALEKFQEAADSYSKFLDLSEAYYSSAERKLNFSSTMVLCGVLLKRGLCYKMINDEDFAGMDFEAIINSAPSDRRLLALANHLLASTLLSSEKWSKVIELNNTALRLDPMVADAYQHRALAYRGLGMAEEAEKDEAKFKELEEQFLRHAQEQEQQQQQEAGAV